MSLFTGRPRAGDWVALTRTTPIGLIDHLTGTGVREGTPAVVTATWFGRVDLSLADGHQITVSADHVRILRRGGRYDRLRVRNEHRALLRTSARIVMLLPIAYYAACHLWTYRSSDGIMIGLLDAAVATAVETVGLAVTQPIPTAIFLAACWAVGKFATLK